MIESVELDARRSGESLAEVLDTVGWLRYMQNRLEDDERGPGAISLLSESISLQETGDPIVIDIPARVIKVDLDDAILAERRADMEARGAKAWKPFGRKRAVSPALRAYAAMTTNAAKGAVRDVSQIER